MTTITIFGKKTCGKCITTKNKLTHFLSMWKLDHAVRIVFHDMDSWESRAEGAYYDVRELPVTIVERDGDQVARWDGEIPDSQAVRLALQEGANVAAD